MSRPIDIFQPFQRGDHQYTSEYDVCRRQILTPALLELKNL